MPSPPLWQAPVATDPVNATVALPGSKSMTNRALILATLAETPTLLRRPLRSRDTLLMVGALRALGAEITGQPDWRVTPLSPRQPDGGGLPVPVDVGNAGTVLRFVPPVAALVHGDVGFDGDPRARERPVGPLLGALRTLGAHIYDGGRGALPFTVHGHGGLAGGRVTMDASVSSQLVSGLLLAAPGFAKGAEVRHQGPAIPSAPHLAMTVHMLRTVGAEVDDATPDVWRVAPGKLDGGEVMIEPDLSNAAPFLAAAMITGGRITVSGWPAETTQPGRLLHDLLTAMGGSVSLDSGGLTVRGGDAIHGIDADLRAGGELTPTIAALAALADSPSRLYGVAHLRTHETDRLAALASEIGNLGGDVRETDDGLVITPRPLRGGIFGTHDDHRLATAAAVLGLAVPDLRIENIATTGKTLPEFADLWTRMLAESR